jgi:hypothetical protein
VIGAKTAQADEDLPKLVAGSPKVTAPDEPQAARGSQGVLPAKGGIASVEDNRAHECRRAHETDVLELTA